MIGVPPATITFSGQMPIRDVVRAMRKAIGVESESRIGRMDGPAYDKTISVDWKNVPFWEAAAQIEELTGMHWMNDASATVLLNHFLTSESTGMDGLVAARTPYFRIVGNSTSRVTKASLPLGETAAPAPSSTVSLDLTVFADPKMPRATSATLDYKLQLKPDGPWTPARVMTDWHTLPEAPISTWHLNLPPDIAPGTTISRIAGTFNLELVHETQTFKVPDVFAAVAKSEAVPGTRFSFSSAKMEDGHFKMSVAVPAPKEPEGFRLILQQVSAFKLFDSAGHPLISSNSKTEFMNDDQGRTTAIFALTYGASAPGGPIAPGPVSLQFTATTVERSYPVAFELKDVKVP